MTERLRQRRPRRPFDRSLGVEKARRLFHQKGYDGVSVADLTKALDINPPSLYAAYGSKAGLYDQALRHYADEKSLPASDILDGHDLGEAIATLLVSAAEQYTRDPACRGCMVTEGRRAADPGARAIAEEIGAGMIETIKREISQRASHRGDVLADVVITLIQGLSAAASTGVSRMRLRATAEQAGAMLKSALDSSAIDYPPQTQLAKRC